MAARSTKLGHEIARRKELERDLVKAKRKLKRTRGELESAQARISDLETRIRRIQQSPPYRVASRLWRVRARLRAPLRGRIEREGVGTQADEIPEAELWISATAASEAGDTAVERQPDGGVSRAVTLLGRPKEEQLVEALTALRGRGIGGSELLVITDCDALRVLDEFGCRYEYVPPREDWAQLLGRDPRSYDDFLRRRLAMIGTSHGVTVAAGDGAAETS